MPYAQISELPDSVRDALPEHGQHIFLAAFNAAYDGTCKGDAAKEECSFRVAWAAVGEKFTKTDQGWVEKEQKEQKERKCSDPYNCTPSLLDGSAPHVILNVLDSFQWFPEREQYLWYGVDAFSGTERKWESVPLIFAQKHPDGALLLKDQTKALQSIQTFDGRPGRVVGNLTGVVIVKEGQPRLEGYPEFTDPEVERLWRESKLSLSTSSFIPDIPFPGMPAIYRKARSGVDPNHVLIFVRSPRDRPGDAAAMFMNNKPESPKDPVQPGEKKPCPLEARREESGVHMAEGDKPTETQSPFEKRLEVLEMELRNRTAAYNQVVADTRVKDEKLALVEREHNNQIWNRIATHPGLPRAMVHGAQEEMSRKEFEATPGEFVLKLLTTVAESHKVEMEKAGEEYVRKNTAPPQKLADVCTGLRVNGVQVGE